MFLATLLAMSALLEPNPQPTGVELARDLERIEETARVLYIAAHPDDENTQLLGYLANERGWRAAYLSLTRGEGGQNAIGDEIVHALGVIRTYELLSARLIDGAEQFISRQRDFGYSKSAHETLNVWGHEEALGDVVWVIRKFRPQVVVTRFPEEGRTHGHHLASAQLAREAFERAGDPTAFPGQLQGEDAVSAWQPTRLLYNVPLRWMGGEIQDEWYTVDLGGYDPLLGRSYGELAAESRSMHRSQAFGSRARRGPDIEAFELLAGDEPAGEDPFGDIPSGWEIRPGGVALAARLQEVSDAFDPREPAASIPGMFAALDAANQLEHELDRLVARDEIAEWISAAAGLYLDARVEDPFVAPGDEVPVALEVLVRGDSGWSLEAATLEAGDPEPVIAEYPRALGRNEPVSLDATLRIDEDARVSTPYWLERDAYVGSYTLTGWGQVGRAIAPPAMMARFHLQREEGQTITVERPIRAVDVDPTLGERVRPLTVLPPLLVAPSTDVLLVPHEGEATLTVDVEATTAVSDGLVRLRHPVGWTVRPELVEVSLAEGERTSLRFSVEAPAEADATDLRVTAEVDGRTDSWIRQSIEYAHLPPLTILLPASVRAAPIEWNPPSGTIGYVMGPGDAVAAALQSAGVDVQLIDDETLISGDLEQYRAILVGVRAFHTRDALKTHADRLWDYAAQGGNVVVQYQTNNRSQQLTQDVGPEPIEIGRGRVTVESAPVDWLEGSDAIRDGLHDLVDDDFTGWVQERGLYFAESWDSAWTPLIAMADPGEEPEQGALLVMEHGDGSVFYVGLSLFRQLPAGVAGAYRLLANLIAFEPER